MIIHVIIFTLVWSQMPDGRVCLGREDQTTKERMKQCASCFCENIATNNNCTFQLCTRLWVLCRESSTSKFDTAELLRNRNEDRYNMDDKLDQDDVTMIYNRESTLPTENNILLYERSTESEREQNKTAEECDSGKNVMIRVLSVDYKMPALDSVNVKLKAVIVMIFYPTIVVIGITICIIVYRKYGYDIRQHRHNSYIDEPTWRYFPIDGVQKTDKLQAAMANKFLLSDRPPSYGAFVV